MSKIRYYLYSLPFCILCFLITLYGCVEEIEPQNISNTIQGALVVDARITDKNKHHDIILTRTFTFDESEPELETGATVRIVDDSGTIIDFPEFSPGVYRTPRSIALNPEKAYRLEIVTSQGTKYKSNETTFPDKVEISDVWGERIVNEEGEEGITIRINNEGLDTKPKYFRYEFEETYKVIAPDYNPFEWDEVDYDFFCEDDDGWEVTIAPRKVASDECFVVNNSNTLFLASTENLKSTGLKNLDVRFIERSNYAISHRYSLLVKQYHHDANAASFYESLKEFSSTGNVFSNVQTGRLDSNLYVENSDTALVFGYFELSSYHEKRLFFNYEDFFPNEPLPPYIISCGFIGRPSLYPPGFHFTEIDGKFVIDGTSSSPLIDAILAGLVGYVGENEDYLTVDENNQLDDRAPYLVKPLGCVDCRLYGDNRMPEYWVEN